MLDVLIDIEHNIIEAIKINKCDYNDLRLLISFKLQYRYTTNLSYMIDVFTDDLILISFYDTTTPEKIYTNTININVKQILRKQKLKKLNI